MAKKGKRKAAPGTSPRTAVRVTSSSCWRPLECGIELTGSEVKSLRDGKAQISDAYAAIEDGEVWLRNAHIPPYEPASDQNHEPERAAQAAPPSS